MKKNWFIYGNFVINMDKVAAININDDDIIIVYEGGQKETCKVDDVNIFASELGKWITK